MRKLVASAVHSPLQPPHTQPLPQQLEEAGFRRCSHVPPGFRGTMYTRQLPLGQTYVVVPPHPAGLVEAFVGDWMVPLRYFSGMVNNLPQMLRLLA